MKKDGCMEHNEEEWTVEKRWLVGEGKKKDESEGQS